MNLRHAAAFFIAASLIGCAAAPPPQPDPFDQSLADAIARTRESRQTYIDAHPDLSAQSKDSILAGQVLLGMSKDDVKAALGGVPPADCPSSHSVSGDVWDYCTEQRWVGPVLMPEMHKVVTFNTDDKVISISNSGQKSLKVIGQ